MQFEFSFGHRPFEGYTIKRGIGRGGFGQVYFAVSDGGKQVAMKLIRGNLEVELRGMRQCLNLKHTNLIELYDIRRDATGNYWVLMEYVGGDSLASIIAAHPNGLPADLVKSWFSGIAEGVGYLHSQGVVHRDLKPGNIFIDNGIVKIGDYGLCKALSTSQNQGQTQSVGTVYYMAPEIGRGIYDSRIDIYAAGIILYEMLTGKVPFRGESMQEIIMKHVTDVVDLDPVPAEFRYIVRKALQKDPNRRYASIREMAEDVARAGEVTAPTVKPVKGPAAPFHVPVIDPTKPIYQPKEVKEEPLVNTTIPQVTQVTWAARMARLARSLLISAFVAVPLTLVWSALLRAHALSALGRYYFVSVACTWAVLVPSAFWTKRVEDSFKRRLLLMGLGLGVGLFAFWLEGYALPELLAPAAVARESNQAVIAAGSWSSVLGHNAIAIFVGYLAYFGLGLFGIRWWQLADPRRRKRFSFYPLVAATVLALLLLLIWPGGTQALGVVAVSTAAVTIQIAAPWYPAPARQKPYKIRLQNA